MKVQTIQPTGHELILEPDRYILSSTDLTGRITSINDVFIEYSGYGEDELLGQSHNIVRHPDMPRAIFWMLWAALKEGEAFSGYVQNLCKDGSHYWVFAHIQPVADAEGDITGYRSVRRRPSRSAVEKASTLYAEMRAAEMATSPAEAIAVGLAVLRAHLAAAGQSYDQFVARL